MLRENIEKAYELNNKIKEAESLIDLYKYITDPRIKLCIEAFSIGFPYDHSTKEEVFLLTEDEFKQILTGRIEILNKELENLNTELDAICLND